MYHPSNKVLNVNYSAKLHKPIIPRFLFSHPAAKVFLSKSVVSFEFQMKRSLLQEEVSKTERQVTLTFFHTGFICGF